MADNGF